MGLGVGLAAAGEPLQGPPLLVLGVGVLHADPRGGLAASLLAPGVALAQRRVVLRLLRRGADLAGELVGQAAVALVDLGLDFEVRWNCSAMLSVRTAVWSCMRPGRTTPLNRVRPCGSLKVVILMVLCFFLPETNAWRAGAVGAGAADLHFGAVDAQVNALRVGVGEQILQRPQPHPRPVGDGETAGRQQRPDLADRSGDGGVVHPVQFSQPGVRDPKPQVDQRDQEPVDEGQALGPGAGRPPPVSATPLA